ncbi:hypothetical protein QF035_008895 [Streptomyces umbrinus]|uniref:Uncharacterized protein n=1 Tax=Streptomyces umbrinus TaxID=67370 RepID=A0ABU0T6K9_9ACTN|nr:hypothetical protein [Streptomyces umbrinus]MDQ1031313.1 hypothetical protein [Streptomyces umbrinus]
MTARWNHARRPHTGPPHEAPPGEEAADYFALLDAGSDDSGRLYVAGDGVTAMMRAMAEQWQKEARRKSDLDARTLLVMSDRLIADADRLDAQFTNHTERTQT